MPVEITQPNPPRALYKHQTPYQPFCNGDLREISVLYKESSALKKKVNHLEIYLPISNEISSIKYSRKVKT